MGRSPKGEFMCESAGQLRLEATWNGAWWTLCLYVENGGVEDICVTTSDELSSWLSDTLVPLSSSLEAVLPKTVI